MDKCTICTERRHMVKQKAHQKKQVMMAAMVVCMAAASAVEKLFPIQAGGHHLQLHAVHSSPL